MIKDRRAVKRRLNLKRKYIYTVIGVVVLCLLVSFVFAKDSKFALPFVFKQPDRLESRLIQLAETHNSGGDVADMAARHGIYFRDEKIRVIIELEGDDTPIPEGYNIEVEGRRESLVQALVPVDKLYEISEAPGVNYVRVPQKSLTG